MLGILPLREERIHGLRIKSPKNRENQSNREQMTTINHVLLASILFNLQQPAIIGHAIVCPCRCDINPGISILK